MSDITIRQLLEAGCHFGHQTRYWCPRMEPYIFGERNKLHIIDLDQTLPMLNEAMNYLGSVAAQGGKVLFVGTKRQASKLIAQEAKRCNSPFVNFRWLGGMLTNYKTIRKSVNRLKEMDDMVESDAINKLVKKEILQFNRERAKLEKSLSGIKEMNGLPDVLFVIDREYDYIAVNEANKLGIPVVSVVDSNCSPVGIDYVIPGNDDAIRSIRLYLSAAADAINDSRLAALTSEAAALHVSEEETAEEVTTQTQVVPVAVNETETETPAPVAEDKPEEKPVGPAAVDAAPVAEAAAEVTPATEKPVEEKPAEVKSVEEKPVEEQAEEKKVAKKKVAKKKVAKKKVVVKKESDEGDKLTDINGIGPVIEGKLQAMGITTFQQIADFTAERCAEIDEQLSFKGRIEREQWVEQAKKLVS
jgi:small subunit ribosomal protein S2